MRLFSSAPFATPLIVAFSGARHHARAGTSAESLAQYDYLKTILRAEATARQDYRRDTRQLAPSRLEARARSGADSPARFDYLKSHAYLTVATRCDMRADTAIASLARFDGIKTPLVVNAASRLDARARSGADSPARFDSFTLQFATSTARFEVLVPIVTRWATRFDVRGDTGPAAKSSARCDSMVEPGWHVYARDPATGEETFLGFVEQDADPAVLTDVVLADGVWELEARPSEFFWQACRTRRVATLIITGGMIESTGLPVILDLRREIDSGFSLIRWSIAGVYSLGEFTFGLWYSTTTPVDTSGAPDETMPYFADQSDYLVPHSQTANEHVAVAAFTGSEVGPVAELSMPWDTSALVSPPDQHATNT